MKVRCTRKALGSEGDGSDPDGSRVPGRSGERPVAPERFRTGARRLASESRQICVDRVRHFRGRSHGVDDRPTPRGEDPGDAGLEPLALPFGPSLAGQLQVKVGTEPGEIGLLSDRDDDGIAREHLF